MTETTPPDVPTRHIAVTLAPFSIKPGHFHRFTVPKGYVTWSGMLGQTQVQHPGLAPRALIDRQTGAPASALIEHPTAVHGDVLTDEEVAAGVAVASQKQALVPGQRQAREAQRQEAIAARNARIPALEARVLALENKKT